MSTRGGIPGDGWQRYSDSDRPGCGRALARVAAVALLWWVTR